MSAALTLIVEGKSPEKVALGPLFSIGRGPVNDLVINDTRASRNHAVVRLQGDKVYYLVDLGSSNGTLLNGRRVTIPSALKSGDEIQIASTIMKFENAAEIPEGGGELEAQTVVNMTSETVSILVVDIRNFTGLSESIPPEDLSKTIGKWFQEVGFVIEKNGGSIDKFIGDAVMACWLKAKTEGDNNYVLGPLRAAIDLVELAKIFDQQLTASYPQFGFHIGCGVNTGRAILGNVGTDSRREITALGDCVNVAFRLESLCKELNSPIIVSEEIARIGASDFTFTDLGLQKLKGKAQEVRVLTVKR